jgi:hypothetical protein
MTRQAIPCTCGGIIAAYYELFAHIQCTAVMPTPAPTREALRHRAARLYWGMKQRGKEMVRRRDRYGA